jgi:hypothetical protein
MMALGAGGGVGAGGGGGGAGGGVGSGGGGYGGGAGDGLSDGDREEYENRFKDLYDRVGGLSEEMAGSRETMGAMQNTLEQVGTLLLLYCYTVITLLLHYR